MTEDQVRKAVREEIAGHVPPRLVSVKGAAAALGIAETACWALVDNGRGPLRSVKVGRRRLIPVAALDEYVTSLEQDTAA